MAEAADLAAVEARLASILAQYRDRLETATIYGIPTLRRPGAKAHDWFAFVKPAARHVGFFLLPVHAHQELLDGCSPALRARLTGKSTFSFKAIDEGVLAELEELVARAFAAYMGDSQVAGRRR